MILAGDIFDGPDPEPGAVSAVYNELRRMFRDDQPVYYVLGNHDRGRDWLMPVGEMARNVDSRVEKSPTGSFTITGLSCVSTREQFVEGTASAPRTDIGVYHQRWDELSGPSPFSIVQLPDHKLSVCGDVHVRAFLDRPTYPRRILSPGPYAPQSVAEFHQSTVVYAVYEDFSVRPIEVRGRKYVRYDITDAETADAALVGMAGLSPDPTIPKHLSKPMVAVKVTVEIEGLLESLEELAEKRDLVLRIVNPPATPGAGSVLKSIVGDNLVDVVRTWPDVLPEARLLAGSLVTPGADFQSAIQKARADHETRFGRTA